MSRQRKNLLGQRFGFLFVKREGRYRNCLAWVCECDCGKETVATTSYLMKGRKRSCGCKHGWLASRHKIKHGRAGTAEYKIWKGIIKRCENPNNADYLEYGGRGIGICAEWRADFAAFFDHVGPRPSTSHSIDRINNECGYVPGNIRWATPKEQANNRR